MTSEEVPLEADAVCAITRDYLEQPSTGRRLEWRIDAIDGHDDGWQLTDADQARRFRAAATWVRDQAAIVPVVLARRIEPMTIQATGQVNAHRPA